MEVLSIGKTAGFVFHFDKVFHNCVAKFLHWHRSFLAFFYPSMFYAKIILLKK